MAASRSASRIPSHHASSTTSSRIELATLVSARTTSSSRNGVRACRARSRADAQRRDIASTTKWTTTMTTSTTASAVPRAVRNSDRVTTMPHAGRPAGTPREGARPATGSGQELVAERRGQGRRERQPRDQRGLERVVGVRLAGPGDAARRVPRRQLVPPRPVLGVEEAVRRRAATRWRTSRRTSPRPSRRTARRPSRWTRPRPSASARVRRARPTSPRCRRTRPRRRRPSPRARTRRTATGRRRAASPGRRRPARPAGAAPAGPTPASARSSRRRGGTGGPARRRCTPGPGSTSSSKCSGIRHWLPRARSCTTRVTIRWARSRSEASSRTSAAASSASTVCMLALTPR